MWKLFSMVKSKSQSDILLHRKFLSSNCFHQKIFSFSKTNWKRSGKVILRKYRYYYGRFEFERWNNSSKILVLWIVRVFCWLFSVHSTQISRFVCPLRWDFGGGHFDVFFVCFLPHMSHFSGILRAKNLCLSSVQHSRITRPSLIWHLVSFHHQFHPPNVILISTWLSSLWPGNDRTHTHLHLHPHHAPTQASTTLDTTAIPTPKPLSSTNWQQKKGSS